jgi:hypothetical protein
MAGPDRVEPPVIRADAAVRQMGPIVNQPKRCPNRSPARLAFMPKEAAYLAPDQPRDTLLSVSSTWGTALPQAIEFLAERVPRPLTFPRQAGLEIVPRGVV